MNYDVKLPPQTATSGANAAATATISAISGGIIEGGVCIYSYSGAPTNGKVTIKDGSTTIAEFDVTAAGPGSVLLEDFITSVGAALSATIAAGGVGIVGKVSLSGRRV